MSYNVDYIAVNSKKRWKVIATLYNFFNVSAIYTKSCAQIIFPPIFGLFAIFDRNFAQLVSPPSDENENYVVDLKGLWILKKNWKLRWNRHINGNAVLVQTMHPERTPRRPRSVTKKFN